MHVLDAKDARERLPSIQPVVDTLVLDWELGDMTGLDLLRQWKTDVRPRPGAAVAGVRTAAQVDASLCLCACAQLPEDINVIFISGDELEPDSKEECRKLGAQTFWLKPLKMPSLQVCRVGSRAGARPHSCTNAHRLLFGRRGSTSRGLLRQSDEVAFTRVACRRASRTGCETRRLSAKCRPHSIPS